MRIEYLKRSPKSFKKYDLATAVDDDYLTRAYRLFMKHGAKWFFDKKHGAAPPCLFETMKNNKENVEYLYAGHVKCVGYKETTTSLWLLIYGAI